MNEFGVKLVEISMDKSVGNLLSDVLNCSKTRETYF